MDSAKKLFRLGAALAVLVAAMVGVVNPAGAVEKSDVEARFYEGRAFRVYASSGDSKGLELWYKGTSTEAVVAISSHSVSFYAPGGTLDTAVDTDGIVVIEDAAYDTLGEFCAYIDALDNYGCKLLGAKYDDNSRKLEDQAYLASTNLKGAGGFEVKLDTGTAAGDDTDYDLRVWGNPSGPTKRIVLRSCDWDANGTTGTDSIKVFGRSLQDAIEDQARDPGRPSAARTTSNEVWKRTITDDTVQTFDFTSGDGVGWQFAPGSSVVVSVGNGTSVQDGDDYLDCLFEER